MKLVLKNFRCHRDATFDIPDNGLVLLSGESGAGKSTIFKALSYVLFGNVKKPYSHGTNSCQVTLYIKDLVITRRNRPNRLTVKYGEEEYEDESAQGIIHNYFKINSKEFMASSYIVQRSYNSVISMSPSDQTKFIETLAFNDDTNKEYKTLFKEKVKEYKKKQDELILRSKILEREIENRRESLPKTPPENKNMTIEEIKIKQEKLQSERSSNESKISQLKSELEEIKEVENRNSLLKEKLKELEIEVNHYSSLRSNLGEIKTSDEIEEIETKFKNLKSELQNTKNYLDYKSTLEKAEKLKDEFSKEAEDKIKEKLEKLPTPEEREKLKQMIENKEKDREIYEKEKLQIEKEQSEKTSALEIYKEINSNAKKEFSSSYGKANKKEKTLVKFLEKRLTLLQQEKDKTSKKIDELKEKLIHQKISTSVYTCPSCHKNLQLQDEKLILSETERENSNIEDLEKIKENLGEENEKYSSIGRLFNLTQEWISKLSDVIKITDQKPTKHTVKYNHDKVQKDKEKLEEYKRLEKEIEELKSQNQSSVIESLFQESKEKSKTFPKKFKLKDEPDKIEENINSLSSKVEEIGRTKSEYSSLSQEIDKRTREIKSISKALPKKKLLPPNKKGKNIHVLTGEIEETQNNSLQITKELSELQEIFIFVTEYENYQKEMKTINQLEKEKCEFDEEEHIISKKLKGAMGLEEAAREAEILAMKATINGINEHSKYYLEKMFSDPIEVYLKGNKTTCKGDHRTQLNTVVNYKGEDSSIEDLSGGEAQRCELAFLLGVNDMIGSPFILLDECLNNLDAEINMETVMNLKELAEDKLIFVSSHEAVQGTFDQVINL